MTSGRNFDTAGLLATVLVITLLGVALMGVGPALEIDSRLARARRMSDSRSPHRWSSSRAPLVLGAWEVVVRLLRPPTWRGPADRAGVPPGAGQRRMLRAAGRHAPRGRRGLLIAVVSARDRPRPGADQGADRLLKLYANGLYAMPMVAILPLLTIWFGYSSARGWPRSSSPPSPHRDERRRRARSVPAVLRSPAPVAPLERRLFGSRFPRPCRTSWPACASRSARAWWGRVAESSSPSTGSLLHSLPVPDFPPRSRLRRRAAARRFAVGWTR